MKVFTMENSFLDHERLKTEWETNPRWKGITRNYSAEMW
jgi:Isocitrate lyase